MKTSIEVEDKFILFVSPYESRSSKWEMIIFGKKVDMLEYILAHDLTKEHYMFPFEDLLKAMSDFCDKEDEE
jgi:hypothetical protein